jgi:phospholipid/cholesterol/gamma-HCH transport system substrate-binding protein
MPISNPTRKARENELKVGVFVSVGLALILTAILTLGAADSLFVRHASYYALYSSAEGLIPGAKVMLNGLNAGAVEQVAIDPEAGGIRVKLVIDAKYSKWIREDSVAEIATQGVLGDRFVALSVGNSEKKEIPAGGTLRSAPLQDLSTTFGNATDLFRKVNRLTESIERILRSFEANGRSETFFQNLAVSSRNLNQVSEKLNRELDQIRLKSAVGHLNSILKKIDEGNGTLGSLVNDPQLYQDVRSLVGGTNRNRIMRNLVRKTIQEAEEESANAGRKKP